MGRNRTFNRRRDRDDDAVGAQPEPPARGVRGDWRSSATVENETLRSFYTGPGGVVPAEEADAFMASLRTTLPTAMRITSVVEGDAAATALFDRLVECVSPNLGGTVAPVAFIPRALQTSVSRGELKRSAQHRAAKQVLNALSDLGLLSRQEAVSMIPAVLLDVHRGHRVLDLCAAPGSKTTQILETLARASSAHGGTADPQSGVVVANDFNAGRLDILSRQVARLPDAAARVLVTNHDARYFPLATSAEEKFDRVLCDVMCSGDGTLRKSYDLWGRWTPLCGPALHGQQVQVLLRGMALCRAGGMIVYSTCSLNPAEDEAVVSVCLQRAAGAFELVDPQTLMPALKRYPGVRQWRLMSKDGSIEAATFEEMKERQQQLENPYRFVPSMFAEHAAAKTPGIEHCCRVPPHLQDTGGFFIAAMKCVRDFDAGASAPQAAQPKAARAQPAAVLRFMPVEDAMAETLRTAMQLPADFPFDQLAIKSEGAREPKVYLLGREAARTLRTLDAKIIGAGVRVFESAVRHSFASCHFTADGAQALAHVLPSTRLLHADVAALLPLLRAAAAMSGGKRDYVSLKRDDLRAVLRAADHSHFDEFETAKHFVLVVDCGAMPTLYLAVQATEAHTVVVRAGAAQLVALGFFVEGLPELSADAADGADDVSDDEAGAEAADASVADEGTKNE